MRLSLPAVLVVTLLAGCSAATPASSATSPARVTGTVGPPSAAVADRPVSYPPRGSGTYTVASGGGPAVGLSGPLLRYQVAVENEIIGLDLAATAAFVEETLSDPRGWTGGGLFQLQRVGPGEPADFTVYVVTPGTRDEVCPGAGDGYTNCRNGARVVINIERWLYGVAHIDLSQLTTYRRYVVNHETGHRLGYDHELCPGPGQPAPVMQQQSLGLHGCTLNPWPYVGAALYRGQPGSYDDPVPA